MEKILEIFIGALKDIIFERKALVDLAYDSNGGWESWLQVELFYALYAEYGEDVQREVAYENGIADFSIKDKESGYIFYIELKADAKDRIDIDKGYQEDIEKVGEGGFAILVSKATYSENIDQDNRVDCFDYHIFYN